MSRADTIYYTVTGLIIAQTEKAVLFEIHTVDNTDEDDKEKHWFPLSQLRDLESGADDEDPHALDTVEIPDWLLRTKGYI
jgi:hypothetical protein